MTTDAKALTAIEMAMNAEKQAETFYARAAESATDVRAKDLFAQLAAFEATHFRYLQMAHESLGDGGDFPVYEGTDFTPGTFGPSATVAEAARASVLDALTIAVEAEKRAETEYSRMAGETATDAGRAFFSRLASEEALHQKVLNDQFYSLTNDGAWRWGD